MNEIELRALYQRLVALRSDATRADCVAPEQVVALAEGSLPEAQRIRLLRHVSACSFCQRDLSVARSIVLTEQPERTSMTRWAGLAVAAVILVAAVVVWRPGPNGPDVMRSAEPAIRIVRPAGDVASTDSTFVWGAVSSATRYRMEVLTGSGAVVHSAQTPDTTIAVSRGVLQPGDYYWRVTAYLTNGSTFASSAVRFRVR